MIFSQFGKAGFRFLSKRSGAHHHDLEIGVADFLIQVTHARTKQRRIALKDKHHRNARRFGKHVAYAIMARFMVVQHLSVDSHTLTVGNQCLATCFLLDLSGFEAFGGINCGKTTMAQNTRNVAYAASLLRNAQRQIVTRSAHNGIREVGQTRKQGRAHYHQITQVVIRAQQLGREVWAEHRLEVHTIGIEGIHIGVEHIAIGVFINSANAFEQRIGSHDIARLHKHDEIAFHGSHTCRKALIDAKRLVGFHHVDTIAVERIFQIGGFAARRSGINQNKLPAAIALKRNRVHKVVDVMRRSVVKHANNAEKRLVIEAGCHLFEQIRNIGTMLLHKPFMIFGVKRRARCLLVEFGNESFKGAIA